MNAMGTGKAICMLVMNAMDVMDDPRVRREAETAAQAGYKVVVIGRHFGKGQSLENTNRFSIIRLRNSLIGRVARMGNSPVAVRELTVILSALLANIQMARIAVQQRADIYHAHEVGALPVGHLVKKLTGAKLAYDAHELYSERVDETPVMRRILEAMQSYFLKRVDAVITVNGSIGREMVDRYGCSDPVILMNCPSVSIGDGESNLRNELGICRSMKIVLYHGLYGQGYGLEKLIESAKYIHNAVIALRGYGDIEDDLRRLVRDLGVEDKVAFLTPIPMVNLVREAKGADIGVISFPPEGLENIYATPNKLFEYMMAGLAIAASDLPEIRRVVEEADNGILFDAYDPKSIASAINKLVSDDKLLRSAQQNSLRAAREKYNWEKESQKLLSLYETLLVNGPSD